MGIFRGIIGNITVGKNVFKNLTSEERYLLLTHPSYIKKKCIFLEVSPLTSQTRYKVSENVYVHSQNIKGEQAEQYLVNTKYVLESVEVKVYPLSGYEGKTMDETKFEMLKKVAKKAEEISKTKIIWPKDYL